MPGVLINFGLIIAGSLIGMLCRKGIPEKYTDIIMKVLGLCVIYVGISGSLKGENTVVLILAMVFGTALGTLLDIDGALEKAGRFLESRVAKNAESGSVAKGFVTASLLFCVGAMAIVGSFTAGLSHDYETLITKSIIDMFSAMMLSVSLGIGVMFSSVAVLVYQGLLVLLAGLLAPILSQGAINEIVCAGSLMIIGIGLNMLGVTKLKVANFMPAMIFAPIFLWLMSFIPFI